jgi:hypothetical protein
VKKVISIVLSLLLLASSSGIAYAQHFCGEYEMLSQITLGEQYLSCGMAMDNPGCEDGATQDHDCCDNHYTQITTDDTFVKATFEIEFNKTFAVAFAAIFVLQQIENKVLNTNFYADYHPPPLNHDFQILYETFLI